MFLSDPTCAAVEGDRSAFDEYLLLAAKAAELWRRMGKPAALCRGLRGRERRTRLLSELKEAAAA